MSLRFILCSHYAWHIPGIEIAEAVETDEFDRDHPLLNPSLVESGSTFLSRVFERSLFFEFPGILTRPVGREDLNVRLAGTGPVKESAPRGAPCDVTISVITEGINLKT